MTDQDRLNDEIRILLLATAAGEADEQQWARLDSLLQTSGTTREYAIDVIQQMSALEWSASDALGHIEQELPQEVPGLCRPAGEAPPIRRRTWSVLGFSAIAAVLLIGGFTLWMSGLGKNQGEDAIADNSIAVPNDLGDEAPAPRGVAAWVARLTQSTPDATWARESGPNEFLLRLRAHQTMELLSGLAEVEFASGAVVILHGPCLFIPTGPDSAILKHGRVTGRAENGNFQLITPSANVVDLGTEFGVVVDEAANTNVVVFEGEVSVSPRDPNNRRVDAIFLDHGATAHIGKDGEFATGISIEWEAFERAIPAPPSTADELLSENQLSLIDIINGGDGRGRTLAGAIDALTGTWDQRPWLWEHGPGYINSDGKYHRSASHSMIDGVFIPARTGGDTLISSTGFRVDLPACLGATFGPIWARRRGGDALPSSTDDFWGTGTLPFIIRRIEAARVGALGMHPNVGITLDLFRCSEEFRGRFQSFEAILVNLDLAADLHPERLEKTPVRTIDFWVYVDGKLKYSRRSFGRNLEGEFFSVDLAATDRFLTLVATDGEKVISFDHLLLVDPVLKLTEKAASSSGGKEEEK